MPTREAILKSLKEDGFDTSWSRLWAGRMWKADCHCCKRPIGGAVALMIEDRMGPARDGAVLCMDRAECRKVRDGICIDKKKIPLEEAVVL